MCCNCLRPVLSCRLEDSKVTTDLEEMGMSEERTETVKDNRRRRWLIYAVILALVFLLGFVPTCMVARRRGIERDTAQTALRISNMQNSLGNAMVDARAGNYELARQATSDFFTKLGTEIQDRNSIF